MFNPKIVSSFGEYETEETCLSLSGARKTKRCQIITVEYETRKMEKKKDTFVGFTAQIIQHEIDHTNGIII
jgi:peptide deformylase